jgi:TRAP-type mannitol/chloroaromatic compound transport system substrate-binding protein
MKLRELTKTVAIAALAGVMSVALTSTADAQKRVRWKMHSAFASKIPIIGTGGKKIEETIDAISGGTLQLKFFEPNALVPGIGYFDPVAQGSIEAAWGTPGYVVGKVPAIAFFSAVPFGPSPGEYIAWMGYGGGRELYEKLYHQFGAHGLICSIISPEASGWFRKEITSLDQLKGMKMRFFGLGAKVMEKFGVSTQLLAGGDIYPALELGTIDATEFSMPAIDEGLGFFQVAKHYYFPGWHQQTTLGDLVLNKAKFDALDAMHKAQLETMCGFMQNWQLAHSDAIQGPAMARMQEKGVTIHKWSDEILSQFESAWNEVAQEEAAKDPVFKEVWDSYSKFRKEYVVWKNNGYLK